MNSSVLRSFRPIFEALSALALGQQAGGAADLRPLRADLRKQLLALKQELDGRVSERESYLMLFAPVVYLDELVRTSFPQADHATWPLLQKELFDTDRGGELFYRSVDEILEQKLAPVVYQVYHFSLGLGFRGQYAHDPERRTQTLARLRDRLAALQPPALDVDLSREQPPSLSLARLPRVRSRAWPWAAAAALVVALYLGLSAMADATLSRWRQADSAAHDGRVPLQADNCGEGVPCRSS